MLLPPEVAKGMTVFPLKSYDSMKVLIIVGQVYHQMAKIPLLQFLAAV